VIFGKGGGKKTESDYDFAGAIKMQHSKVG